MPQDKLNIVFLLFQMVIHNRQNDILEVLKVRFGKVPDEIAKQVKAILDLDRLSVLHKKAVIIENLQAFAELLQNDQ